MRLSNVCVFRRKDEDLESTIARFHSACKKENILRYVQDHAQFRTDAEKQNDKEQRSRQRGGRGRKRRAAYS